MAKLPKIKNMKFVAFLFIFLLVGCKNQIQMTRDMDLTNSFNNNKQFRFYFETSFSDSIYITYGDKLIFNKLVKTLQKYEVSEEFRTINKIEKGTVVNLTISGIKYTFKPLMGYQYYYFSKGTNGIEIVYSNIMREYY